MTRYFLLFVLLSTSLCINAQDSCENNFRPINTLNKYEVDFLNSYLYDTLFVLNDIIKIAFEADRSSIVLGESVSKIFNKKQMLRYWEKNYGESAVFKI